MFRKIFSYARSARASIAPLKHNVAPRIAFLFFACSFLSISAIAETPVFGPETYFRETGKPQSIVRTFTVENPDSEFSLVIQNGEGKRGRVSSAVISLNGDRVVGPNEFNKRVDIIDKQIDLEIENEITVEVRSQPGTSIIVTILGPDAPPSEDGNIQVQFQPAAFLTEMPAQVRVQARILPDPQLDPQSVDLFEVDADEEPVGGPLCALLDDGDLSNGDDVAGDNVFSCFVILEGATPGQIGLVVLADIGAQTERSAAFYIDVVDPLTEAQAQIVLDLQLEALALWEQAVEQFGNNLQARTVAAQQIGALPGIRDAGVSSDGFTIWIEYDSGVSGGLLLNPPGTQGGGSIPLSNKASVYPQAQTLAEGVTPVGNASVLIWTPYNSEFGPFDPAPTLRTLYEDSSCPKFSVTYLPDSQATVNSVRTFANYGTVIINTHGGIDGEGQVIFATRERADLFAMLTHSIDLVLRRLSVIYVEGAGGDVFTIRPSFISNIAGTFDQSVVYHGYCSSFENATMVNAFSAKGAATGVGYDDTFWSDFGHDVALQFFTPLVEALDTTGSSFTAVTPKIDPKSPNATVRFSGDANVAYDGALKNGDFETGDLTAWTRSGDGRVVVALGEFSPPQGIFMGLISTGLGFTTTSGSVEQNFCLAETATQLNFDWNFSSEEFVEWCGQQHPFDDPFEVELVTDGGTTTLFRETVDTLCGMVAPTGLAFDQSGAGCTPSEGVGVGTGGNDCTVWSTGWQSQAVDISGIAAANEGKGVTLRFRNSDAGDSIFDSAVLLDWIEVVNP